MIEERQNKPQNDDHEQAQNSGVLARAWRRIGRAWHGIDNFVETTIPEIHSRNRYAVVEEKVLAQATEESAHNAGPADTNPKANETDLSLKPARQPDATDLLVSETLEALDGARSYAELQQTYAANLEERVRQSAERITALTTLVDQREEKLREATMEIQSLQAEVARYAALEDLNRLLEERVRTLRATNKDLNADNAEYHIQLGRLHVLLQHTQTQLEKAGKKYSDLQAVHQQALAERNFYQALSERHEASLEDAQIMAGNLTLSEQALKQQVVKLQGVEAENANLRERLQNAEDDITKQRSEADRREALIKRLAGENRIAGDDLADIKAKYEEEKERHAQTKRELGLMRAEASKVSAAIERSNADSKVPNSTSFPSLAPSTNGHHAKTDDESAASVRLPQNAITFPAQEPPVELPAFAQPLTLPRAKPPAEITPMATFGAAALNPEPSPAVAETGANSKPKFAPGEEANQPGDLVYLTCPVKPRSSDRHNYQLAVVKQILDSEMGIKAFYIDGLNKSGKPNVLFNMTRKASNGDTGYEVALLWTGEPLTKDETRTLLIPEKGETLENYMERLETSRKHNVHAARYSQPGASPA